MLKAKDRKRRSEYRERRRVEKETLQQQVEELTTIVTEQQKAKNLLVSSTWEMVAKRQLQARLNSEAEQRRLYTAIESRSAVLHKLSGIVQNDLESDTSYGDIKIEPNYQHKRLRVKPSDAEFYEAYLRDLDGIYAQTDEILTVNGLDSTDTAWGDPQRKWKEENTNGYYMYLDKQILPFGFEETSEKLWQVCDLPHRQQDRQAYNGAGDPDNTVAFTFRNTTRLNSGRVVSVLQRVASRRYRTTNRMVIVWRSLAEGEGIFTGMNADETGWAVITPLKSETLMRTCMRYVPMHFTGSLKEEYAVKEFTELVLETGAEETVEITNALGKLLLKDE
ncbi:hypothetical protein PHMEG_00027249 [Phytophthora megakarya]|uniref:M96 mating-specific protein n=1 Tax=Phytophthora megakarya TaxID=4795 RepID=A0A225V678_9STRA|nr:hypothetical protein PHMEG_00027249 [Phytophthora megakarya]